MSNPLNIGSKLDEDKGRDAIHMAVISVQCGCELAPGDHVTLRLADGRAVLAGNKKSIGVIDPFLTHELHDSDWVWLFLRPGTVTGLKHHWFHPSLPDSPPAAMESKKYSELWLRDYAKRKNSYDEPEMAYENLMQGLRDGELYFHGEDLHSFGDLEQPEDLRRHAEAVLGEPIKDWGSFEFSCSC